VDAASIRLDGRPIDPAARYRVTVNNFLAEGGDGFTVLREGTDRRAGGSDLALVSRFHWRLGTVFVGPRAGVVGHFYQFKPSGGGDTMSETKQFGFTIGPELAWPISSRVVLEARLSYEATNADIDDKPNGHPPHAVGEGAGGVPHDPGPGLEAPPALHLPALHAVHEPLGIAGEGKAAREHIVIVERVEKLGARVEALSRPGHEPSECAPARPL